MTWVGLPSASSRRISVAAQHLARQQRLAIGVERAGSHLAGGTLGVRHLGVSNGIGETATPQMGDLDTGRIATFSGKSLRVVTVMACSFST